MTPLFRRHAKDLMAMSNDGITSHIRIMDGNWKITDITVEKVAQRSSTKVSLTGTREPVAWGEP